MIPDPEKVRVWDARAAAYDRLCRRWEIFPQLSNYLIDLLPPDLHGPVLDLGSGTGLTSECLLARHPRCQPILVEPSKPMLAIARRNLAGRDAQFLAMGLDQARSHAIHVVAAIASVSMQFVAFDPAFGALAAIIAPGGPLAFNLWWHHWEETATMNCMDGGHGIVDAACRAVGIAPPPSTARAAPKARSRGELIEASTRHGFRLLAEHRDEYPTPAGFGLDFDAMDPDWPVQGLAPETRQDLLAKIQQLARGKSNTLVATRFLFQRADETPAGGLA